MLVPFRFICIKVVYFSLLEKDILRSTSGEGFCKWDSAERIRSWLDVIHAIVEKSQKHYLNELNNISFAAKWRRDAKDLE